MLAVVIVSPFRSSTCVLMSARASQTWLLALSSSDSPQPTSRSPVHATTISASRLMAASALGQCLGLDGVELSLSDGAPLQEAMGLVDLPGRAAGVGDRAHIVRHLGLSVLSLLGVPLRHVP